MMSLTVDKFREREKKQSQLKIKTDGCRGRGSYFSKLRGQGCFKICSGMYREYEYSEKDKWLKMMLHQVFELHLLHYPLLPL